METTYPADLEFDISDERHRAAVLAAVRVLGLISVPVKGSSVFYVTVTSPKEAYEFGALTTLEFQRRK